MSWLFQSTTAEVYPQNLTVEVYPLASCSEPSITSLCCPHLSVALVTSNDLPSSRLSRPDYATLPPRTISHFATPVPAFVRLCTNPNHDADTKSSAILLHLVKLDPEPRDASYIIVYWIFLF